MTDDEHDARLFAQALELGRLMGWHDGSGRSRHQEYVNAYRGRRSRADELADAQALIRHADLMNRALVEAALAGGELADLVVEQQRDDRPWVPRPRHIISLDDPAATPEVMRALRREVSY